MTFAAVGSIIESAETTAKTFTLAPHAVGNLVLLEVVSETSGDHPTGVTSTNATWTTLVAATTIGSASTAVFLGVTTSTSSVTATVTISSGSPPLRMGGWEFTTTVGSANVALDTSGTVNATTLDYPSLSPGHGSGELYFGYALNGGAGYTGGSTTGFTFQNDSSGNGVAFNPACGSGAQQPVWTGTADTLQGIAVLLRETSTPVSITLTAAQVTVAANHPGSGAGPLAIPAAQVTVAAKPPGLAAGPVTLPAAQVSVAAKPAGPAAGPLALPAAQVTVRAYLPVPTVPPPGASLTTVQVTVAGHAPAPAAGPLALPVAQAAVRAYLPVPAVLAGLPPARVTVAATAPLLPVFVLLPAARVTVTAGIVVPPFKVALTTAQVTVAGRAPAPGGSLSVPLPPVQVTVQAYPLQPPVQDVSVTVNATWTGASEQPSGYNVPWATAFSAAVAVANTDRDWMVACCWWRTLPGGSATVSVADDAHNLWSPAGAPAGTSPDGTVRCSVWVAPSARVASKVIAAATGYIVSVGITVMDVSGLTSWLGPVTAGTAYTVSGSGISAAVGALPGGAEALYVTVGADAEGSTAVSLGGGWTTAGTTTFVGAGTFTALTGVRGWAVGTTAKTAAYTGPSGTSWAACTVAIPVTAAAPPQLQPGWPLIQLQAAFGSGAQDPVDTWTWTDISSRFLSGGNSTVQRGTQYELNALQAANITLTLDNNDLALSPSNTVSPYYPGVQVDTPMRLLATWRGRTYSLWSGFTERWPETWETGSRYGLSPVTVTDAWSMLTGELLSITRESYLTVMPYAYWPLGDPAVTGQGATSCANVVPGNTIPIMVAESKSGAGAAGAWSLGNGTWLWPDDGGTVWEQTGLTAAQQQQGFNLIYDDPGMPSLTGGVTFTAWYNITSTVQPGQNCTFIRVSGPTGPVIELAASNVNVGGTAGNLLITTWNGSTRASATTTIDSGNWLAGGSLSLFVLALTPTTWTLYYDGLLRSSPYTGTGSFNTAPVWVEFAGLTDRYATGQMVNCDLAQCAVFPRVLNVADSMTLFCSGFDSFELEGPSGRATRLLTYSGYLGPRFMDATIGGDDGLAPSPSLSGTQAGTAISDVAQGSMDLLYVDGNDVIMMQQRQALWNLTARWVLGESAAQPLNRNWSFTGGISPWTATGGTVTAVTSPRWHQGQAAALAPSGSAATAALVSETVTVTAGVSYKAGMQVYSAPGYGSALAQITWLNSGGGTISVSGGRVTLLPAGAWTWMEVTAAAPAGAVGAKFGPAETGTPAPSEVLVLGEATVWPAAAEYPYEDDISVSYDKQQLYNDAQITTIGPSGQSQGPVIVQNPASIIQHGDFVYQVTSSLNDPGQVIDSGQWLVSTAGDPQLRIDQVTVNASANPFNTDFVLGVEIGDIVTVNRRPPGAAQPLSLLLQVISVKKTVDWQSGTLQAQLACNPYPGGSVLSADDPVHGQLTGGNLLPW